MTPGPGGGKYTKMSLGTFKNKCTFTDRKELNSFRGGNEIGLENKNSCTQFTGFILKFFLHARIKSLSLRYLDSRGRRRVGDKECTPPQR